MNWIFEQAAAANTIAIAGHVRPDGDCIGSSLALMFYLRKKYPQKTVDLYLEKPSSIFSCLPGFEEIVREHTKKTYDLFFAMDSSSEDRLEYVADLFMDAKNTICIDHHISNTHYADATHVIPEASSTAEVLYELIWESEQDDFDDEQAFVSWLGADIAAAVYIGIAHDTGLFKYNNTSPRTMRIAAMMMETGIPFSEIIDRTFSQKTYVQAQIMGRCLLESIRLIDGKVIISTLSKETMDFYGISSSDLDGIIEQLRNIKGVEAAALLHETQKQQYKVSMRSNGRVDVQKIAIHFGGGGHVRAAGCTIKGPLPEVKSRLIHLFRAYM